MSRIWQLRIYDIELGHMDDFVRGWTDGIAPLRREFGYGIEGAWVLEDESRFVWIVFYDGPEDWDDLYRRYMDSDGRKALDPDPAQWIERSESWLMHAVDEEVS